MAVWIRAIFLLCWIGYLAPCGVGWCQGQKEAEALVPPEQGQGQKQDAPDDIREDNRISLNIKGMDVVDVLKILSDKGGFSLSISGKVVGKVTLFLEDIDLRDALEIVLISADLAYEQRGDIIYVTSERDYLMKYGRRYWDKRKLKIFNLRYAASSRLKEFVSQVISKVGKVIVDEPSNTLVVIDIPDRLEEIENVVRRVDRPLETKVFSLDYLSVEDVSDQMTEMLTPEVGILKVDKATNKLVITDYPEIVEKIAGMITTFDEKPLQVLIDAKIVEIKPSRKFYSGINWDYWIRKYFRISQTFSIPTTSTDKISVGNTGVKVAEVGQYSAAMEFLQIFGETKILSSPRIVALNNQEAKILVGTKDVYITSTTSQTTGSSVTTQQIEFVDVGVKLYVTPTINKKDYITLKIKPEISSSQRETIKTDDKETQVPIVTTSEAETTVIVKDGVNIIIGGLKKVIRDKERKQVPLLGNIPLLGGLFRSKKAEWSRNELVILLTPHIISGDISIEAELREKLSGVESDSVWESDVMDSFQDEMDGGLDGQPLPSEKSDTKYISKKEPLPPPIKNPISNKTSGAIIADGDQSVLAEAPSEYDYYLTVIRKIKQAVGTFKIDKHSEVRLRFVLSRDGKLLGVPVILSPVDTDLQEAAQEIIRRASPFPRFLPSDKKDKRSFEVLLVF